MPYASPELTKVSAQGVLRCSLVAPCEGVSIFGLLRIMKSADHFDPGIRFRATLLQISDW
jgi:hypothetical protein